MEGVNGRLQVANVGEGCKSNHTKNPPNINLRSTPDCSKLVFIGKGSTK